MHLQPSMIVLLLRGTKKKNNWKTSLTLLRPVFGMGRTGAYNESDGGGSESDDERSVAYSRLPKESHTAKALDHYEEHKDLLELTMRNAKTNCDAEKARPSRQALGDLGRRGGSKRTIDHETQYQSEQDRYTGVQSSGILRGKYPAESPSRGGVVCC